MIKNIINNRAFTQLDKLLLILYDANEPIVVAQIREKGLEVGLRLIKKWNISAVLNKCGSKAIKTSQGWELTQAGRERAQGLLNTSKPPPVIESVRKHLAQVTSPDAKQFIEEAICCFEAKLYRPAVVFSWVGAVFLLYH